MEKTNITCIPNGPMIIEGQFVIKDAGGNVLETQEKVYLCRCGASSKKPFCDGTHKSCGFKD